MLVSLPACFSNPPLFFNTRHGWTRNGSDTGEFKIAEKTMMFTGVVVLVLTRYYANVFWIDSFLLSLRRDVKKFLNYSLSQLQAFAVSADVKYLASLA